MKTLMKKGGIGIRVAELNGYLQAVRDMNDDHSGKRYWFSADMIHLKNNKVSTAIHCYLKTSNVEIREVDLEEELEIIEAHILDNYLQGTSDANNEKQCYVMRLHGWRIQEYIAYAANYEKVSRWVTEVVIENNKLTAIFIKIKRNLIVMRFLTSR
jgi:hypothetical protein